jgi:hypothetical protein
VSGLGSDDDDFVNADGQSQDQQSDDGVPVGEADAEQDRLRASDQSDDSDD